MMLFVCSAVVESNLDKLETSCTVILPPTVSVLWIHLQRERLGQKQNN